MASKKSRKTTEAATMAQLAAGGGKSAAAVERTPAKGKRGRPPRPELHALAKLFVRLPADLKMRLDVHRAQKQQRLEDVVRVALEDYLERNKV